MNWDYDQQQQAPEYYPPRGGSSGKTVLVALVTSLLTSVLVFFALRELEHRGIIGGKATPAQGSGAVEVPSLIGLKPEQARELLRTRGLLLNIQSEREDAAYPAGTIMGQVPMPGSQAAAATAVHTIVAKAVPMVVVPNVAGLSVEDATRTLNSLGVKMAPSENVPSDAIAVGAVVGSRPAVGTQIPAKGAVVLQLSAGPSGSVVPKLIGQRLAKAKKAIEDAGFKVGKVSRTYDRNFGEEVVLKQTPLAEAKAAPGSVVDLVINE